MSSPPPSTEEREKRRRAGPRNGGVSFFKGKDGVRLRYGLWRPEKNSRGTVFVFPGRTEFIEKYFETIADLLDRGLAVVVFDWRGQGLSGRPLKNEHKDHRKDFRPLAEDLKTFLTQPEAASLPKPWFALGHSMGGFCFLLFLQQFPEWEQDFKKAVLIAPMLGIDYSPIGEKLTEKLLRWAQKHGKEKKYALLQMDYGKVRKSFLARNKLTSDVDRFQDEHWFIDKTPALAIGGVTYGWLDAARKAQDLVMTSDLPKTLKIPVCFVMAGREQLVSNRAIKDFIGRMSNATSVTLKDARHEILKERDEIRNSFWKVFDNFIFS